MCDSDHLDLIKLVLADHPASITSCTSCLFSKTGCVACHQCRQFAFRKNFIVVHIGQRYFSCRDQVEIFSFYFEKIILKFWQLPCSLKHLCVIHEWYTKLFKTLFPVGIEKEVYQCSFKPCCITT